MDISQAIKEKHLLAFNYDGYPRTVEPHTYGVDGKGHEAVRAYQVAGGSSSGEYRGWKLFHVAEMRSLQLLPETFMSARQGYSRNDKAFSIIYAEL